MTEKNKFKMPFLMKADRAARIIVNGIERGARIVEFPRPMSMFMRLGRNLPSALWDRVIGQYAVRQVDPSKIRR